MSKESASRTLAATNTVDAAGTVNTATEQVRLTVSGEFDSVEAIRDIGIRAGERSFRLGDIAEVRRGTVEPATTQMRFDGQAAVGLAVSMRKGGDVIRLGEGESRSGGHKRPSILADALEAVIGAVHLDAGYAAAEALVHRLFEAVEINPQMQAAAKDAKTALQEWLQGRKMQLPQYRVVGTAGVAHRQTFEVECAIAELALAQRGSGASRRAAEQSAAAAMLATLKAPKP